MKYLNRIIKLCRFARIAPLNLKITLHRIVLKIAPKIAKITFISIIALGIAPNHIYAKEPTNWIFGFGLGTGQSKLGIEFAHLSRDPTDSLKNQGWLPKANSHSSSWAFAWEFMLGYKHFLNDFVGFRYYGNIGIQHYKPVSFKSKEQKIAFVDYTLNADLLIDFYESEFFAIGMLGGMGFGGTSFDKDAIGKYLRLYDVTGHSIGLANVQRHFFNVNASIGLRAVVFQKIRRYGARVCDAYKNGKRICRVPVYYIGHNIEFNAKFPLMDYYATPLADIQIIDGKVADRPGYKVTNPYRLTIRYIVDF